MKYTIEGLWGFGALGSQKIGVKNKNKITQNVKKIPQAEVKFPGSYKKKCTK